MSVRRIVRVSLGLAVLSIFLVHSSTLFRIPLVDSLEHFAYDARLNATLPNTVDKRIVIADVDEKSLSDIGRWPWDRNILADLMDTLFDYYQIKVVGFDMVFAEKDESSGLKVLNQLASGELVQDERFQIAVSKVRSDLQYDQIFANSLKGRNIVMGQIFNQHEDVSYNTLSNPIGTVSEKYQGKLPVIKPKGYTANLDILQKNATTAGFFDNPTLDEDGIFRRVPIIQEFDGGMYESLALAVTRLALDSPELKVNIEADGDYYAIEHVDLGEHSIPVDSDSAVLVAYRGRQNSFPYLSITDILNKQVPKDQLQGRIVLIGTSAPGLLDLRSTPVQNAYPGVEVHANIISSILDDRIKHRPPYIAGFEFLLLLILGIALIIIMSFLSPLWTSVLTLGVSALIVLSNLLAWNNGLVLPLASPVLLIISLFVLQMSYGFFVESRGKRALAKLFGQYIPPELVDEMSDDPTDVMMEGQSKEMTVLFSDVRGFTTISEGLDSKELSQLMNSFLTPMTRVIHNHRGTIDKYMGDAIMAFWGAPLDDPYHAKNALLAALDMIEKLNAMQDEFKKRGWPPITVGVGLNTGTMSVGNMGSEFRMAYTVMGDAVNLGSRLEGLTKEYGVSIIVSEFTAECLSEFEFLELDYVAVKGKDKPVKIYEPIGLSIELEKNEKSEIRRFNKAVKLYRQQQWDLAEQEIFSLAQSATTKNRPVYKIYMDRIMYFRNNPPGEHWNGVFTYTTK